MSMSTIVWEHPDADIHLPRPRQPVGYRIRELVAWSGLTYSAWRHMVLRGELETVRIGRTMYITPASVRAMLDRSQR